MRIVLSGPPSVGKTTQGRLLGALLGVPHVSSGEIIRNKARDGDHVAQRLLTIVSDGSLSPSQEIIRLVRERLDEDDCRYGFILDGFPRKPEEAWALLDFGFEIDACLRLSAPASALMSRLGERARQAAFFRADDDPAFFPRRIANYEAQTLEIMRAFRHAGVQVQDIDASRSADEVHGEIAMWASDQFLMHEELETPRLFG